MSSSSILRTNECLYSDRSLRSGEFAVVLTNCGELQILWGVPADGSVVWSANAGQPPGNYVLRMQGDGRLSIFVVVNGLPSGQPIWSSTEPSSAGEYFANLQTDGNLAVYRGTAPERPHTHVWDAGCVVRLASENCGVWSAASTMGTKITLMLSSEPVDGPMGNVLATRGTVTARSINTSDLAQRWMRWERHQNGNLAGYVFVNRKSGLMLCGAGGKGTQATATNRRSDLIWFRRGKPEAAGYYALAPIGNEEFVLNVFGDGPYVDGNKVGLWTWSSAWTENINSTWVVQG